MKKILGFTLAEIMIVFVVIGVLAGILVPIAVQSSPDENVMKFKKANTTLAQVIRELVTSDKYYLNGDLGIRANGDLIDGSHEGDYTYFCNSVADTISTKKINCSQNGELSNTHKNAGHVSPKWAKQTTENKYVEKRLDERCKNAQEAIGAEIIASDSVVYFQENSKATFGVYWITDGDGGYLVQSSILEERPNAKRLFGAPGTHFHSQFDEIYKIFCIDVDGIPNTGSTNCDDKKDICPFGYGIRADGKILPGARADEWLEKSMQKGKDE